MPELKPELSSKNRYWIPKHRYYELKHYCLQYPHWQELYAKLEFKMEAIRSGIQKSEPGRPVEKLALIKAECAKAIELVEKCCQDASHDFWPYLLKAVTKGVPFVQLRTEYDIPCSQDTYYTVYRKFFYILSQRRGL